MDSNIVNLPPNNKSGLYKAPLHTEGGVQVIVDGVKKIEVEGEEYHLSRLVLMNNKEYEFKNKTNLEILDYIFKDNKSVFVQGQANASDYIICRLAVLDKTKHDFYGTAKDFVNLIQGEHGCKTTGHNDYTYEHRLGGEISDKKLNLKIYNYLTYQRGQAVPISELSVGRRIFLFDDKYAYLELRRYRADSFRNNSIVAHDNIEDAVEKFLPKDFGVSRKYYELDYEEFDSKNILSRYRILEATDKETGEKQYVSLLKVSNDKLNENKNSELGFLEYKKEAKDIEEKYLFKDVTKEAKDILYNLQLEEKFNPKYKDREVKETQCYSYSMDGITPPKYIAANKNSKFHEYHYYENAGKWIEIENSKEKWNKNDTIVVFINDKDSSKIASFYTKKGDVKRSGYNSVKVCSYWSNEKNLTPIQYAKAKILAEQKSIEKFNKEKGETVSDEKDFMKNEIDKHFNVSGKYKEKGIGFIKGVRQIYTDGTYAGKNVLKPIQKDAERLYYALNNGEISKIKEIRDKYYPEWNKSRSLAGTQRDRFVRIDTSKVELYNAANAVLIYVDKLMNQLKDGSKVELEHIDTLEKVSKGELSPKEGAVQISRDHIAEDTNYYEKLEEVENPFGRFIEIVKSSKNFDDAFSKVKKIKDFPSFVADEFSAKYNPDGKLSMEKAFKVFYDEHKGDDLEFKVTEQELPYKGNPNAKWVKVTHITKDGETLMQGVAIDLYGSKEKAVEAAKEKIKSILKKESEKQELKDLIDLFKEALKENPNDQESKDLLELYEENLKELNSKFEDGGELNAEESILNAPCINKKFNFVESSDYNEYRKGGIISGLKGLFNSKDDDIDYEGIRDSVSDTIKKIAEKYNGTVNYILDKKDGSTSLDFNFPTPEDKYNFTKELNKINNGTLRLEKGGSINSMTKEELKAFYNTKEGKELDRQTHAKWKKLVNMSKSELEKFYNSEEGKEAGLSASEAKELGIDSGRESARWIMKMKDIPYTEWTSDMWRWAKKQIRFISRMSGVKGDLYDDKGNKTPKYKSLMIWGNNPEKYEDGGKIEVNKVSVYQTNFSGLSFSDLGGYFDSNFTDVIDLEDENVILKDAPIFLFFKNPYDSRYSEKIYIDDVIGAVIPKKMEKDARTIFDKRFISYVVYSDNETNEDKIEAIKKLADINEDIILK